MVIDQRLFSILGWLALVTLVLAVYNQVNQLGYTFFRPRLYLLNDAWGQRYARYGQEGFENATTEQDNKQKEDVMGVIGDAGEAAPASASYLLAADVFHATPSAAGLTAKTCFKTDYEANTNLVGNYIQQTNNYPHRRPDSCSAPRTEMVNSFYDI